MISRTEHSYIHSSLTTPLQPLKPSNLTFPVQGIRPDGRTLFSFRPISLALGVAPQANGSARCSVGGTDVVVGVRCEVGSGGPGFEVTVDCTPAALSSLPSDPSSTLQTALQTLFNPLLHSPHLSISHTQSWSLFADITILSSTGGTSSTSALYACVQRWGYEGPEDEGGGVSSSEGGERTGRAGEAMAGLLRGNYETKAVNFELVDKSLEGAPKWPGRNEIPVALTIYIVDQQPFLDATLAEAAVATSQIFIGFTNHGSRVCHVSQLGGGELEYDKISSWIKEAGIVIKDLQSVLDAKWEDPGTSAQGVMLGAFA